MTPTKIIHSLAEMLAPDSTDGITFGAHNESLRKSQVEALHAAKQNLEAGETKIHIVMPGGSGKTRLGIALAYAMYKYGRNSLFVIPSQQALRNFVEKANDLGLFGQDIGAVYEGEKRIGKLTFITYASLLRRVLGDDASVEVRKMMEADHQDAVEHHEAPPPEQLRVDPKTFDLAIWDEAHMYLTANAQKLIRKFEHAVNIGLTATPRYYEGKEVAHVFGKKTLEVNLDTAKERNEICDFENILVDTGIQTGIQLTSPDQEESAQVSTAINRRDRNLIFADLYKNATVSVTRDRKQKEYSLAGEPTIVFGASINHVHDMANAINAALTPALKTDSVFRARLRGKGIDPDDPELVIAAPIHSGASETHPSMPLDERNALVERYHNRKVLMLCATSVLQQSFDSPMTSVVMDSVPRQTYVGVGQAGMRATRPGKEIAFIINTQDADHPSLTFEDFRNFRGREEGVAVEITTRNGSGRRSSRRVTHAGATDNPVASYTLSSGEILQKLAAQRRAEENPLYEDSQSHRHFTTTGYARVNQALLDIASGSHQAIDRLIDMIQLWMERTKERIAPQVLGNSWIHNDDQIDDVVADTLIHTIKLTQSGSIASWSRFSTYFQNSLRDRLEKTKKTIHALPFSQLERPFSQAEAMQLEYQGDPSESSQGEELRRGINRVLKTLSYREREILKLRTGYSDWSQSQMFPSYSDGDEHSYKEIGEMLKLSRERIRQIEHRGARKLEQPSRREEPAIRDWIEEHGHGERPLARLLRKEQNEILAPLKDQFRDQILIIWNILRTDPKRGFPRIPAKIISQQTGLNQRLIKALSVPAADFYITEDFVRALSDDVLADMKNQLPRYYAMDEEKMKAFDAATQELKKLLQQFLQAGGKPLPSKHRDMSRKW